MQKKIKRKNNDAKDVMEYGAMVLRQDPECAPSLDGAVLLPDDEGMGEIIRKCVDNFEKKMKERIERMKLKCTKSKSTLFTTGRAYKVLAATYDEDMCERVYLLETDRGSTCYTGLKGCQGEFKAEEVEHDV